MENLHLHSQTVGPSLGKRGQPPKFVVVVVPDCSPPKFVVVVIPDCSPPKFVVVVVPDCSPPKFVVVVVPDCSPPKFVVVVIPDCLPPKYVGVVVPDCSPPKSVVVVVPDCSPPKSVVVVVPDCSPPKSVVVVVPDCLPPKSVVVVVFNFMYHYSPSQADSLHSCCMRFWTSDCSSLQHVSEYSPKWGTYSTVLVVTWLVPCLTAAILTCSMYTMHHAKVHMLGAFMFSCHLPDTCLAKWPGSLMCYCNSMGVTCTVLLKPAFFLTTYVGRVHV